MKYFIVKYSLDETVVGKDYPQAYKFMKGYDPDAPNALFSLYKYYDTFPDYIPDLDGFMLSGPAKLTDFVSSAFDVNLFVISKKVKLLFEQYQLCPHRFYPLGLYKRKVRQDYFMLSVISDSAKYVDFKRTIFFECNIMTGEKEEQVFIDSWEDLMQKREKLKQRKNISWTIWAVRIVMGNYFNKDLDLFRISWFDSSTYVSERLKSSIESHGLTGWEFTPAENLIVED